MFVFAVERTLSSGVGGMVLFASEVSRSFFCRMNQRHLSLCKVWHIDGQRYEHYRQISPFYL
jgi:hypothetical protein